MTPEQEPEFFHGFRTALELFHEFDSKRSSMKRQGKSSNFDKNKEGNHVDYEKSRIAVHSD